MPWESIGGNPAPGSVADVVTVARSFAAIAAAAAHARDAVAAGTARLGPDLWRGRAADAFRSQVGHLPATLHAADDLHQRTAGALVTYGRTLEAAQGEAAAARTRAEAAVSEQKAATARRARAEAQLDDLTSRQAAQTVLVATVRDEVVVTFDPTRALVLRQQLLVAQAGLARVEDEVRAAEADRDRAERDLEEATTRLERARADAEALRARVADAARVAVRTIDPTAVTRAVADGPTAARGGSAAATFEVDVELPR